MPVTSIRHASVADIDTLVSIHNQAWQETYAGKIPQHRIDELSSTDERRNDWVAALERAQHDPELHACIGFVDGTPAGFALAWPSADADAPRATELKLLYTLRIAHGTGLGRDLVDAVLGDRAAWLWMLDDNPRAERFYAKLGFARFEEPVWRWPHAVKPDVRLARDAQGPAAPRLALEHPATARTQEAFA
ncbi:GNAT family N-acetyltransferase [Gulosibacter sp. ACHW.36C]|uniref:GNAT family N-acetyltransferase n=1 Tax=Gulosibacter sediminis TaxID=1729695 RepID=A0ABY4MW97_9MICO|nr:GNAT family N-acetyltransferase [Gulosibacter sediminis]UQN14701.1 GNAT family N-acetyltransferase [Gulosibacter sediminis]